MERFWTEDPNCVVASFHGHMSSASVRKFHTAVRLHSGGVRRTGMGYIHPGTITSRGAVKAIAELLRDPTLSMSAWVCCIAGDGFWAATGRGMAAGVLLTINATAPVHMADSLPSALRWLRTQGYPEPTLPVQDEVIQRVAF